MPTTEKVRLQTDQFPIIAGPITGLSSVIPALRGRRCSIDDSLYVFLIGLNPSSQYGGNRTFGGVSSLECREAGATTVDDVVRMAKALYDTLDERVSPEAPLNLVRQILEAHGASPQSNVPFDEVWACMVLDPNSTKGYSIIQIRWSGGDTAEPCHLSFWENSPDRSLLEQCASFDHCLFVFGRRH